MRIQMRSSINLSVRQSFLVKFLYYKGLTHIDSSIKVLVLSRFIHFHFLEGTSWFRKFSIDVDAMVNHRISTNAELEHVIRQKTNLWCTASFCLTSIRSILCDASLKLAILYAVNIVVYWWEGDFRTLMNSVPFISRRQTYSCSVYVNALKYFTRNSVQINGINFCNINFKRIVGSKLYSLDWALLPGNSV